MINLWLWSATWKHFGYVWDGENACEGLLVTTAPEQLNKCNFLLVIIKSLCFLFRKKREKITHISRSLEIISRKFHEGFLWRWFIVGRCTWTATNEDSRYSWKSDAEGIFHSQLNAHPLTMIKRRWRETEVTWIIYEELSFFINKIQIDRLPIAISVCGEKMETILEMRHLVWYLHCY